MRIVNEEQMDISGFGGVRERVLLLDRNTFSQRIPDECWDGFGHCVYLANAWFLPGGETGMHYHDGMDIVSVIPRGRILHQGNSGNGAWVSAGQVQLQRDGQQGIRHNESNPSAAVQPMMQVWIKPDPQPAQAQYHIVDVQPSGLTCVYGGELFKAAMRVDILQLQPGEEAAFRGDDYLLFLYQGSAQVTEAGRMAPLRRGDLAQLGAFHICAEQALGLMMLQKTPAEPQ